jgi:hypothetical protein
MPKADRFKSGPEVWLPRAAFRLLSRFGILPFADQPLRLQRGQLKHGKDREGSVIEVDEQRLIALVVDFDNPQTQFHGIRSWRLRHPDNRSRLASASVMNRTNHTIRPRARRYFEPHTSAEIGHRHIDGAQVADFYKNCHPERRLSQFHRERRSRRTCCLLAETIVVAPFSTF